MNRHFLTRCGIHSLFYKNGPLASNEGMVESSGTHGSHLRIDIGDILSGLCRLYMVVFHPELLAWIQDDDRLDSV
jgi:hypothetical protein